MTNHTHPFHLVNPSPWPAVGAFALLLLTLGSALAMHGKTGGIIVLGFGFILTIYTMYVWWKDVIHEGLEEKAHTSSVRHGLRAGMGLFIASEVMFFFGFFFAYFSAALYPEPIFEGAWPKVAGIWPPKGITTFDPWDIPFLNTLILLLSGTTVTWAHHSLLEGKKKDLVNALAITVFLGVCFTALQAYEYSHAAFGFKDGKYASVFFMSTGFHGLHVIIGTIFLAVCLVRAYKGQFSKEGHLGFEFAAWYWHFVDVVWLFLFVCIYWWGR